LIDRGAEEGGKGEPLLSRKEKGDDIRKERTTGAWKAEKGGKAKDESKRREKG